MFRSSFFSKNMHICKQNAAEQVVSIIFLQKCTTKALF